MPTPQQGFLLTRHSFDIAGESHILLWLATDDGPVKLSIIGEKPVFFVARGNSAQTKSLLSHMKAHFHTQLLSLKTFQQETVVGFYFDNQRNFYDARTILQEAGIELFESSFRLADRYLMERFVYGGVEYIGQELKRAGYREIQNAQVRPAEYVPSLRVLSLDIECSQHGELFSIGYYSKSSATEFKKVQMIGEAEKGSPEYIEWVEDERALLKALVLLINEFDPDIIIGWSVVNFDFRVLHRRSQVHGMSLRLGRGASTMRWRDSRTERGQGFVEIDGRVVVDGIAALKAEAYNFPSFSLENIAQHFLGRGKSTEDVANRLQTILHDFAHNKQKLANYNLQDCVLVWDIFEETKLMDFLIFRSHLTGLELDRAGGSVAAFTNLYLPKLHRQGYVSPNLPEDGGLASPGGYVMESLPGLYRNVLVLDFKSLYPSIIKTFKIDPLGLVEGLKNKEEAIEGFRGAYFSRDKNLLPDIITQLWQLRDKAKKDDDKARSQAIKILMNSFYGVLGSGGCPFYDTRLASSITLRGHAIMQQTAEWIEAEGYQVIYGDTDSTFVLLGEEVTTEQATAIGKELEGLINQSWMEKLQTDYQINSELEIEFESHFSVFLMPTIRGSEQGSKKRYAGLRLQGDKEELVFKGLENVRTDWTQLAKGFQFKLYQMVFHGQDPSDFIRQTVEATLAGKNDQQLIYRKRLRRPVDDYVKSVPPHVKAARFADDENIRQGKSRKYDRKGWIEYLITVNGPQPMEYLKSPIDYQHYIDKQIEPVADAILPFIGLSFEDIVASQMGLF